MINIALIGNPNSGKTTLFNNLTKSSAHVGNWPGVTVEKKTGICNDIFKSEVVDLPGIYSLSPYTPEELVARNYLSDKSADVVINIVDATNLERNLYLTTQLIDMGLQVVVALNMVDSLEKPFSIEEIDLLEKQLKTPVVPISAKKEENIDKLLNAVLKVYKDKKEVVPFTNDEDIKVHIENILEMKEVSSRFEALKLLEGDKDYLNKISHSQKEIVVEIASTIQQEKNIEDIDTYIATSRYEKISSIVSQIEEHKPKKTTISNLDKLFLNKFLGFPIFLLFMWVAFFITFESIGGEITGFFEVLVDETVPNFVLGYLEPVASDTAISLVVDAVIPGLGVVFIFMPQIVILYILIAVMEDSGYMARVAFITDNFLKHIGLSGKSFVNLIMGFGCTVPAILGTRTIKNKKEQRIAIFLAPFMSCGARMPVYLLFAGIFFANTQSKVIFNIYLLGILAAIVIGFILNKNMKDEEGTFILEMPPYRIPSIKNVYRDVYFKIADLIKNIFTTLLAVTIILWFLETFTFTLQLAEQDNSILASIGKIIAPIFAPLGFGDWRAAVAVLTGLIAKEVVVASMAVLYTTDQLSLSEAIMANFSEASAMSFLVFILLYFPCYLAYVATQRELGSKLALKYASIQTLIAYVVSFMVYNVMSLMQ